MKNLYKYRFEIFLSSQVSILFGSLLFPNVFFEETLQPILFLLNICAGLLLISKNKKLTFFVVVLLIVSTFIFGSSLLYKTGNQNNVSMLLRMSVYFLFHIIITWSIIQQVWSVKLVNKNVIIGLISGYISLGLLGFFLFISIQLTHIGAFQGVLIDNTSFEVQADALMYYAYITILTIGYGEIIPAIPIAQKASILVGLVGQFYMVIVTAVVIEKYIRTSKK